MRLVSGDMNVNVVEPSGRSFDIAQDGLRAAPYLFGTKAPLPSSR